MINYLRLLTACVLLMTTSIAQAYFATPPGAKPLILSEWQLSSPYSDYEEGLFIGNLIDGDETTHWHSDWHHEFIADVHWVEVALDVPTSGMMRLYMHRRLVSNDHPTLVLVSGTADGINWFDIATLDMPYTGQNGVLSDFFEVKSPVLALRLSVLDCYPNYQIFWHAAELQIYQYEDIEGADGDMSDVCINEVQVSNVDQFIDTSFNYGGWIELYNQRTSGVYLNGAILRHTDADGVVDTYQLLYDHGLIPANGFATLWFDHHSSEGHFGSTANLNIPFKLDTEGGTIELLSADSTVVSQLTYPAATPRCSYARTADGGDSWGHTGMPTPGATNATSNFAVHRLSPPEVSVASTLFDDRLSFSVTIPEGATLRYTTDGSTPTYQHGEISTTGRFATSETRIYRFVLVGDGWLPSRVVTRSFIKNESSQYYLPVISLSTHPDNLFSDEIGLYVKGTNGISGNGQSSPCNWNMDWERPVNLEFLVPENGEYVTALNQECEFKISGGWSRAYGGDGEWQMKSSFTLKSGKIYEGLNSFDYPIFGGSKPYNKYKAFKVRNGGNDTFVRLTDPGLHEIFRRSGFNINYQSWRPAHIFINGRYLGMLNIRESNNKYFAEGEYGIDTDDVDQFELNSEMGYQQKEGSKESFMRWLQLTKKVAANPTNEVIWKQLCEVVDVDEFCNYMAAELYMGSGDWLTNSNNIKGFRNRVANGKYHMVMFDLDSAFGDLNMIGSIYSLLSRYDGRYSDNDGVSYLAEIFFNMLQYEPFKKQFIDAFCLVGGSVMEPQRCEAILNEMATLTADALKLEGADPYGRAAEIASKISYDYYREARISNVQKFFGLPEPYQVKLSSNTEAARLLLGGQEVPTQKFEGPLFAPIVLTAKAPAGYQFKGWQMSGTTSTNETTLLDFNSAWDYYDQGSLDNTNWYANNYNSYGWVNSLAPFGYGTVGTTDDAADYATTLDYGGDPANKRPTYYFRTTFDLRQQPSADSKVYINFYLDDGAIFYVNGIEVGNYNIASGATYNTYTNAYAGHAALKGKIEIPAELLQQGSNLIAVEVHNTSAGSSDIFFSAGVVSTTTAATSAMVSTEETFNLSNALTQGNYELVAVYEKMANPDSLLLCGASPVRINEVSAGNDVFINDYFKKKDWIELYNTTDRDIDLAGMYLSDNRANPQKYQISAEGSQASTILPANGYCIVWCDDAKPKTQLHTTFKLDNADGAYVTLQAADGSWADEMTYMAQEFWQTYGLYPDGGYYASLFDRASIGLSNTLGTYNFVSESPSDWVDAYMAMTLQLQKGWNWMSHNLSTDVDKSRFTTYAQELRGQAAASVKDPEKGWTGSLNALQPALGYKLKMNDAAKVTLRGNLFDVLTPVTLQKGWNWIGCPLYNPTALDAALANYRASEGDAIVGLEGFATYEEGEWSGSLTTLSPGASYLLLAAEVQEFCWNALSSAFMARTMRTYEAPTDEAAQAQPFEVNIHAYPDVTSIIASLTIDEERVTAGNYTIAAFCGEECRGVAVPMSGLYYINIHGEGNERVTFKLMDETGESFELNESLDFAAQQVVGSRQQPFALTMTSLGISQPVELGATPVSEVYYDLNGRQILRPVSGICIKRTTYDNGKVVVKKIINP